MLNGAYDNIMVLSFKRLLKLCKIVYISKKMEYYVKEKMKVFLEIMSIVTIVSFTFENNEVLGHFLMSLL